MAVAVPALALPNLERPAEAADHEGKLLAQTGAGDHKAFTALYDQYSRSVYSLALRVLRDPRAAQDVTQEVFLGVWRGAGDFDARRGSPRAWILGLAHHKSVDRLRRERLRTAASLDDQLAGEFDVGEEAIRGAQCARVREALRQLPARQREAIVLAYYEGYTQQQIARRLGVPLGTVKTRIRDGMLRLRVLMQPSEVAGEHRGDEAAGAGAGISGLGMVPQVVMNWRR